MTRRLITFILSFALSFAAFGGSYSSGSRSSSSSRSYSSSSSSSRSYSSSSGKSYSSSKSSSSSSPKSSSSSPSSSKSSFSFFGKADKAQAKADSKASFAKYRSQQSYDYLKSQPKEVYKTRSTRQQTVFKTYYTQPQAAPTVVYQDNNWNPFFWMWLLDRPNQQAAWVYNHRSEISDERYKELVAKNKDLEAQIKELEDKKVAKDPNYAPSEIDKDLMYSDEYVKEAQDQDGFNWFLWLIVVPLIGWAIYAVFIKKREF